MTYALYINVKVTLNDDSKGRRSHFLPLTSNTTDGIFPSRVSHLHELPGQVIGKELFFFLIVDGECLFLLLESLNLLK